MTGGSSPSSSELSVPRRAARAIRYEVTSRDVPSDVVARVEGLIARTGARRVCELGAGANPALSLEFVREHQLEFVITDVSSDELSKAPAGYESRVVDLNARHAEVPQGFELAFSREVVEHIREPEVFHRNVFSMLAPGGRAMHHFPTLYGLPFLANRLLPERLTSYLLERLDPARHRGGRHEKFPAFYRWCRGPTRRQVARFRSLGFEVEEYVGFFGHSYYAGLENRLAGWLVEHPQPLLTSYGCVVLRKPEALSSASQ